MKITKNLQKKLEEIFRASDFQVRYEKGNFRGGYCILEENKVIVINKFYPLESKINTLIEVLRETEINESELSEAQLRMLNKFRQKEFSF